MVDLHHPSVLFVVGGALLAWLVVHRPAGVPLGAGAALPRRRRSPSATAGALRVVAVVCLALVAAAPHRTVVVPGDGSEGVAVMVALDVSESMGEASAWGPRKIDVAVDGVRDFLAGRPQDLVGLVTFHRTSVMSVPPMLDRSTLMAAVERARTGTLGDGTSLGVAVGFAADRLRSVEARSRVIILVTDGESNAGALDPLTAARAARALDQRLFIVEVGAGGEGSRLLSGLAAAGAGRHFPAGDASAVNAAYHEIDAMEPTRFAGPGRTVELPVLGFLIWVAAGLLAAEHVLRASGKERLT